MRVYLRDNGMVMVFGFDGEQIPGLQGPYDEVKDRVSALVPESEWVPASYGKPDRW